jgi:hypothetical protein
MHDMSAEAGGGRRRWLGDWAPWLAALAGLPVCLVLYGPSAFPQVRACGMALVIAWLVSRRSPELAALMVVTTGIVLGWLAGVFWIGWLVAAGLSWTAMLVGFWWVGPLIPQVDGTGSLPRGGSLVAGTEREAVLPDRPWVGDGAATGIDAGDTWIVCADLVGEEWRDVPWRNGYVHPVGPLSTIRRDGARVGRDEVPRLRGFSGRLVLIPAGTRLRVEAVSGSWMVGWGGSTDTFVRFAMPDGRTLHLTTEEAHGFEDGGPAWGLDWSNLACLAVVVPEGHPLVGDPEAAEALIARVERIAHERVSQRRVPSAEASAV